MKPITLVITLLLLSTQNLLAQNNLYPNELKGYGFFRNGIFKALKLGTSTKEDVIKLFGENCEGYCDYDQNWEIWFSYIQEDSCMEISSDDTKQSLCPSDKFVGRLYSITLHPKKRVSFAKVSLSSFSRNGSGYSASHGGMGGGTNISYDIYSDGLGLTYSLFDRVSLTTEKKLPLMKKGDLISIEYEPSQKLIDEIFVKQK